MRLTKLTGANGHRALSFDLDMKFDCYHCILELVRHVSHINC
jgi:hypothetical protein